MRIYIATIEWHEGDESVDVMADTTAAGARRQALVRLAEINEVRVDMDEATELFRARPISPHDAEVMDDDLVLQYLAAMHEIATTPWVELQAVKLENSAMPDEDDGDPALGPWPMVDLTEYGL